MTQITQKDCTICSQLGASEYASSKGGHPEDTTSLPGAAHKLTILKDFKPNSDRKLQLRQCPQCATYYEYTSDYEFLVNGTEDEENLTRLSSEQAEAYLKKPVPER